MIVVDDRTAEQQQTLRCLVVGTDRFLSGWGLAEGGLSYAAWACSEDDVETVLRWARQRADLQTVRVVREAPGRRYKPSHRRCAHLHVFAVTEGHVALSAAE